MAETAEKREKRIKDWMYPKPVVDTEAHTKPVVATQTENMGHKYTVQQIEEHCEELGEFVKAFPSSLASQSVQIIRQLQAKLNKYYGYGLDVVSSQSHG